MCPNQVHSADKWEVLLEIPNGEAGLIAAQRVFADPAKLGHTPRLFSQMASDKGDLFNVDLTVGDIYGRKCTFLPLKLIASSLGKATHDSEDADFFKSFTFLLISNIAFTLTQIVT